MGHLFAKPVSNMDKLNQLTEAIKRMEKLHSRLQVKKELWVEGLIVYGAGLYFVVGGCIYLLRSGDGGAHGKLYVLCYALYPILLVLIKEFVIWAFNVRLDSAAYKLSCLRGERKDVVIAIMKTEPWKMARASSAEGSEGSVLARPTPERTPPRRKGILEKLFEVIAGEGSSCRFALICSRCCSHNGMALREEFEFISFQCYNCGVFNPARKLRPPPPKLGAEVPGRLDGCDEDERPRERFPAKHLDPSSWRKSHRILISRGESRGPK